MQSQIDTLVISSSTRFARAMQLTRYPLRRLVLPRCGIDIFDNHCALKGSIWWAERQGRRVWMRGYGFIKEVLEEVEVNGKQPSRQLIVELTSTTSERFTLSGHTGPSSADISKLLEKHSIITTTSFGAVHISPEMRRNLEARRLKLADSTWSYDLASRHLKRLIQVSRVEQDINSLRGDLDQAWAFARTYFSRAELIKLNDRDEYEVAAAIFAGYEGMPENWQPNNAIEIARSEELTWEFQELDPEDISVVDKAWNRSGDIQLPTEALEQSSKRHQQILKSLARVLKAKGLPLTYNRYVDLRSALPSREIFFEVKTATPANFLRQVRLAVGQLQEYQFRYKQNGDKPIKLVAVVEDSAANGDLQFARDFLNQLGIRLVLVDRQLAHFSGLLAVVS